ncbi:hypothetical protein F3Y22_tig00116975pilonHSYRG00122 [Hibiscus syriacus]|uniref:Peptidase metallopeptidase domain-containing protein n=1 Tax=Hibiscus syriacus TaxID=106335 RepID=A0A6A2WGU0_HIBSY|nr:metalloendoproteinase 1-like [Hibiscus syriacus]KAE8658043.1 hypothetical protein F3Y22_tig00116975pilonHSYRG00122 [Hibiscus syriacus]
MDDKFDYALEFALRAYQQFYRLNVTGKIDPNTLKAMSTPRCGVPDINIEQTSNYVLFDGRMKWFKYDLTYNYLSNSSQVLDLQDLKLAIARAFQTWRNASKFTFRENTTPGANTDIGIGFFRRFHGDGEPFDGPLDRYRPNVVAHATPPQSRYSFLQFDADEIWSTNPAENTTQVDIESIALHELGHILGLNHSQKEEAVMYAIFPGGQKRVLKQDDIDGITDLYK